MGRQQKNKKPVQTRRPMTDGKIKRAEKTAVRRHSTRHRVQTVLHQAPSATVVVRKNAIQKKKQQKDGRKIAKVSKVANKKKTTKNVVKAKKGSKKGNERLVPRDNVKILKEASFFGSQKTPEFVSSKTYFRWLIRAIRRRNMGELKEFFKSKRVLSDAVSSPFSYQNEFTAISEACKSSDFKITEEFFKLYAQDANTRQGKKPICEPNFLELKTTGRKNFHMLGRATRQVEMGRGGREGNNALINYEVKKYETDVLSQLVKENTSYTTLVKLSKIQNAPFQEHNLQEQVVSAVRMGHRELASVLAQGPAKMNFNDLHRATLKDEKLPTKILPVSVVKKGFNNRSITPIHTAAIKNTSKFLEELRAVHPTLNLPDQDNWYTIHYAAVCEGPEPLKYLLKNGGSVSSVTKRQETPLHCAARAGRAQNIRILLKEMIDLEIGADNEQMRADRSLVNARTRTGLTALQLAIIWNRVEAVEALLDNETILVYHPTSTGTNKVSPLMLACSTGNVEIVNKLIAKGALIEGKDKKKRTSLIHALINGQDHIASILLAKGANINAADSSGNTGAHYAAAYGFLDCLKLLASVDADVLSSENDWKLSPMSIAYLKGHYGIVTWLLDGEFKDKVNINAKDNTGATLLSSLLSYADESCHQQLDSQIRYLTERGADSSIADSDGMTALHCFSAMQVILKGSGEAREIDETRMDVKQYRKCFEMLLTAGASVEKVNNDDESPLHIALRNGNLYLFKLMLEKVQDRKKMFENWSKNDNVLHQILCLPMRVYSDRILWKNDKLTKPAYDVLPLLKDLYGSLKESFKIWANQPNKEGVTPLVAAIKAYSVLKNDKNIRNDANTEFIKTVTEMFEWIIRLDPVQLTSKTNFTAENVPPTSLPILAMNINIEDGKHESNHLALFKVLIKLCKEQNVLNEFLNLTNDDDTIILQAVKFQKTELVELILNTANDVYLIEGVHTAVKKSDIVFGEKKEVNKTLIMYLIEKGMSDYIQKVNALPEFWNRLDSDGNNVWHYAARVNSHKTVSMFKFIEEKGVKRIENKVKRTPLHLATLACDGSANSVLEPIAWLSTRTDVGLVDEFNRTALHYAFGDEHHFKNRTIGESQSDPISVVSLLSSSMNLKQLNTADIDGNTVLHLAALRNSTICMMTLIRKKLDVEIKNNDGNTPLALAVSLGRQSSSLTLIQANANVTETIYQKAYADKDDTEKTEWYWHGKGLKKNEDVISSIPAQVVSKGGSWEAMVYVLLDVLGQSTNSIAQLADAALRKKQLNLANQLLKNLEAILDGGLLTSDYDLLDTFAAHIFESLAEETIERTVLDRIISVRGLNSKANDTTKIIQTALRNGNWRFLGFLKDRLQNDWKPFANSTPSENPIRSLVIRMSEIVVSQEAVGFLNELVKLKARCLNELYDFDIPQQFRNLNFAIGKLTPISWAALSGKAELVKVLRTAGSDLKTSDENGRTVLMYALMSNNREVITAIVGDGKDIVVLPTTVNGNKKPRSGKARLIFGASTSKQADEESDSEESSSNSSERSEGSDVEEAEEADEEPPTKKMKVDRKLEITDPTLFNQKDANGSTVLHYLIEPLSWENVELLKDLAASNKTLIKKLLLDSNEPNPIELAAINMNRRLKNEMLKIVKGSALPRIIEDTNATLPQVDVKQLSDVDEDCRKFLEEWAKEHDEIKAKTAPKPNSNSGYETSGEVVYCDETNQYFDVLLNKTDLNYGRYGFHNFYKMQIIKRRDCDLYILFTNWGRIGQGFGEFQTTPFSSIELATKEFISIWKSKTGNEWAPLDSFAEQPKKYRLVLKDMLPTSLAEVKLPPVERNEKEKDPIRRMIQDISDPKKLKDYADQFTNRGTHITRPFGRFTKDRIEKARVVLDKLAVNAKRIESLMAASLIVESELLNAYTKSNDLSSEYYTLIPSGAFEFSHLSRLDNVAEIEKHRLNLNRYEEIETATRFVCGAVWRKDIDRIEYLQAAMECEFRAELPTSDVSQRILEWIHNSDVSNSKVQMIVEIAPKEAVQKFEKFLDDSNQKFLFHGTKAMNLMSIVRNGFLIDPPAVCPNGNLFGSGIYLADNFEKSSHYCESSADGVKYMLVCQAALGNVRTMTELPTFNYHNNKMPSAEKGENTLHYIGNNVPAGSLTFDGVAIPLLPTIKRAESNFNYRSLEYSEYIVRDPNRVLPRYIVIYK